MHNERGDAPVKIQMLHSKDSAALVAFLAVGCLEEDLLVHLPGHVIEQQAQERAQPVTLWIRICATALVLGPLGKASPPPSEHAANHADIRQLQGLMVE